jgi:hypothetical protein
MPARDGWDGSPDPENPEKRDEKRAARRPRDPSYPDRRRLDSDVRAFMRQPSTPWITFDRDSKVAAGEMSVPRAVLSHFRTSIHDGMFKDAEALPPPEPTPSSRLEPSSLIVAHDVAVDAHASDLAFDPFPVMPKSHAVLKRLAAVASGIAIAAIAIVAVRAGFAEPTAAGANASDVVAMTALASKPAPSNAPPTITVAAPSAPTEATAPPEPAPAPKAPAPVTKDDYRAKLGRLAIRGDAVRSNVWLDGKRMLGRGPRSFDVMCGAHVIAVGDKKDATEMEIPCAGELVVGK